MSNFLFENEFAHLIENSVGIDVRIIFVIACTFIIMIIAFALAICLYRATRDEEEEEYLVDVPEVKPEMEKLEPEIEPLDRGQTIDLFFQAQEEMEKEKRKATKGKHF